MEHLENRTLLSVNTSDLLGPRTVVGNQWTYSTSAPGSASSTLIETVIGPTTFMGQPVTEVDSGSAAKPNALKSYDGQDGAGDYVSFGSVLTGTTRTQQDVYSPYQGLIPQIVTGGTPYTTMDTDTITDTNTAPGANPQISTDTETDVITLVSETPTSLTVTAGTYSVYDFHEVQTIVTPNGDGTNSTTSTTTDSYLAANVGLVENVTVGGGTVALSSFRNVNDMLAFIQQPSNSAAADKIAPPITVQAETNTGTYDTAATGSVTISIASNTGTGTLSGTLTEPLVAGLATFGDLSINAAGMYTLGAVDTSTTPISPANSNLFTITENKLVFMPAPIDGVVDAAIAPVKVEIQDGTGAVVTTDNSTVVTLTPVGFTAGNPITNNVATVVGGIATFSSITFSKAGFYQLQATDTNADASMTSGKFKVVGDRLVIKPQPKNTDANTAIPFVVEILNTKNQPDTTATSFAAVSLNTVANGVGAVLSGTLTAQFHGGFARFTKAAGPVIDTGGTYTFTAFEEDLSTGVLAPTNTSADATSTQFQITGDHLVFYRPPGNGDVNAAIPLQVAFETPKNVVDKTQSGAGAVLSLNPAAAGSAAVLSGVTTANFVSGIASFTATAGPMINLAGKYTFTAADPSVAGVQAKMSKSFTISGLHLTFTRQPNDTEPLNDEAPFTDQVDQPPEPTPVEAVVTLVDAQGKKDISDSTDFVNLGLLDSSGAAVADTEFLGSSAVQLASGVATFLFDPANPQTPTFYVRTSGTFKLSATAVGASAPGSAAVAGIAAGKSNPFKVIPYHLDSVVKFNSEPVDKVFGYGVYLKNSKNAQVKTTSDADAAGASMGSGTLGVLPTLITLRGGNGAVLSNTDPLPFTAGASFGNAAFSINAPGTYKIKFSEVLITALTSGGVSYTAVTDGAPPVIGNVFSVSGLHLVASGQPSSSDVNTAIPLTITVTDTSGAPVTDTGDTIVLTLFTAKPGAGAVLSGTTTQALNNGVAVFDASSNLQINVRGTYQLLATAYQADGTLDYTVLPLYCPRLVVSGDHLVFKTSPVDSPINTAIPITVDVDDAQGNVDASANGTLIRLDLFTVHPPTAAASLTLAGTTMINVLNGVATFSVTQAPTVTVPGEYTLTATEVELNGFGVYDVVDGTTIAIAGPFTISN